MKKPDKKLVVIIIVIVIIIIASILFFLFKDKLFKPKPTGELDVDKTGNKINWSSDEFPLRKGSSGAKVKLLQAALNILKNNNLAVDGKFGEKTLAALREGYNVDSLSEANYNTFIKPNITAINDYIAKSHPANAKPKDDNKPVNNQPGTHAAPAIGKTVFANKKCTGYFGKKESASLLDPLGLISEAFSNTKYTLDDDRPVEYAKDQFIGIVEKEDNGWLQVQRTDSTRVFILKSNVYSK